MERVKGWFFNPGGEDWTEWWCGWNMVRVGGVCFYVLCVCHCMPPIVLPSKCGRKWKKTNDTLLSGGLVNAVNTCLNVGGWCFWLIVFVHTKGYVWVAAWLQSLNLWLVASLSTHINHHLSLLWQKHCLSFSVLPLAKPHLCCFYS